MDIKEEKVKLIRGLKKFCVDEIGIAKNKSFTRIVSLDKYYVVYASRKDKIESAFGKWGNRIFENKKDCENLTQELEKVGFDTFNASLEAHGDEICQITRSTLLCSKTEISYIIPHENFHIHCNKRGIRLEPSIEEAVGDCFALHAAKLYFKDNLQMQKLVQKRFDEWLIFDEFVNRNISRLQRAYSQNPEKAKRAMYQAKKEYLLTISRKLSEEERKEEMDMVNNAFFLRLGYYSPYSRQVYEALRELDPREYIQDKRVLHEKIRGL